MASATGEVRQNSDGSFSTVVRFFGRRQTFALPTCASESDAKERSRELATLAKRFRKAKTNEKQAEEALKIVAAAPVRAVGAAVSLAEELLAAKQFAPESTTPTFRRVGERWTSGELHEKFPDHVREKDHTDDKSRLTFLCELDVFGGKLGDVPIDRFSLDHAQEAMRSLPERARRPATRRHYAQTIHRVLALAVWPLRLIESSPLPRGFMPKAGKPPAHLYLFPDEEALLMACRDVPVRDRVLYGVLAREGMRAGEAARAQIQDFDLERGAIRLGENKTDDPRAWALDLGVTQALRRFVQKYRAGAKPSSPMFVDDAGQAYDPDKLAGRFRTALELAGVKRAELFKSTANTARIRVHDLRGTFVTLSLANGKTESWVADRTGHRSSQMINRYRRAARSATELGLGSLAPLDQAIPELRLPRDCHGDGSAGQDGDGQLNETTDKSRSGGMADAADSKSPSAPTKSASCGNHESDVRHRHPSSPPCGSPSGSLTPPADSESASGSSPPALPLVATSQHDPVERALATALDRASAAGEWAVVAQLARELETRRARS